MTASISDDVRAIEEALAAGPTLRPIVSLPGYEADDEGAIWSVATNWRGYGRRPLAPQLHLGYFRVQVKHGDSYVRRFVHALVCEAFHGPRPNGMEVRHLDGCSTNNRPGNLAWGTRSENAIDRQRHGTDTAAMNGLLGAQATKAKFSHLAVEALCFVCSSAFQTRAWKLRNAERRGRLLTCSIPCRARVGATKKSLAALALYEGTK